MDVWPSLKLGDPLDYARELGIVVGRGGSSGRMGCRCPCSSPLPCGLRLCDALPVFQGPASGLLDGRWEP